MYICCYFTCLFLLPLWSPNSKPTAVGRSHSMTCSHYFPGTHLFSIEIQIDQLGSLQQSPTQRIIGKPGQKGLLRAQGWWRNSWEKSLGIKKRQVGPCPCSYMPSNFHPTSFLSSLLANLSFLLLHTWDKLACCSMHHWGHSRKLTASDDSIELIELLSLGISAHSSLDLNQCVAAGLLKYRSSKGCSLCVYALLNHTEIQSSCCCHCCKNCTC